MNQNADRFTKLAQGDPVPRSARQHNALLEAAQKYQRERFGEADTDETLDFEISPANLVLIQAGASGINQFTVSTYGTPAIATALAPSEVRRRPMFAAGVPTAATNPVAITVEPAIASGFARAVASGDAVCRVLVNSASDRFASPVPGVTDHLASNSTGGYPILGPEVSLATPGSTILTQVLIGGSGTGGVGGCVNARLVAVSGGSGSPAYWTWYQQIDVSGVIQDAPTLGGDGTANALATRYSEGDLGDPQPGDDVVMCPDPETPGKWTFIPHPTPAAAANLSGCGWLTNPGLGSCLKLTVTTAIGECNCEDETQNFYLYYTGGFTAWLGADEFKTCCGCTMVAFTVDMVHATATLTLINVNNSCQTHTSYSYGLFFEGCQDGVVIFTGTGPDNCNGIEGPCGNIFRVKLTCGGCPAPTCDCVACCLNPVGGAILVSGTSPGSLPPAIPFGSDCACLSGPWVFKYDPGTCSYVLNCSLGSGYGITGTLVNIPHSGTWNAATDSWTTPAVWRLTLSGACGTIVYTCPALNWVCCGTGASFASWTCISSTCTGGTGSAPGINVGALSPNGNCGSCGGISLTAHIIGGGSDTELPTSGGSNSWAFGMSISTSPGSCGVLVSLFCNGDGTWTLTSDGPGGLGVYTVTATSIDPLFLEFDGVTNECGSPVNIVVTN
jgi:hypothetical protein